ncbi:MAG: ROK family protein [Firmicutes bacterium]|nr:ROK family protein [Bacillota bacterium]
MYRGHSGSTVRSHNRSLLLRLLLRHEPISRVELASITGLTMPTVHGLTKELMAEGIVEELGTTDPQGGGAGRRAALLGLIPGSWVSIGVDLGVQVIKIGVLDIKGEVLAKAELVQNSREKPDDVLNNVFEVLKDTVNSIDIDPGKIVGLGIGVPGLVDVSTGDVRRTPNLGWEDIPVGAWFQERLALPVILDNNIRAMTVGERMFGKGREQPNLISFYVGPGIGAGIMINDEIFRGVNDGAGEVGHTLIDPSGPVCRCGRRGCLEAVTSDTAIIRKVQEAAKAGRDKELRNLVFRALQQGGRNVTIADIVNWAEEGSLFCQTILEDAGRLLGEGVANLINLFNPGLIIVGGDLFTHSDFVFEELAAVAKAKAFSVPSKNVAVVKTGFGKEQGLVGAAALALWEFFYSSATSQTPIDYHKIEKRGWALH